MVRAATSRTKSVTPGGRCVKHPLAMSATNLATPDLMPGDLLKGDYGESVWDRPAGMVSAPFVADEHGQVAVKVIGQRGNNLLAVKSSKEAGK